MSAFGPKQPSRHGLRVSEACDLRWDDINLAKRTIRHPNFSPRCEKSDDEKWHAIDQFARRVVSIKEYDVFLFAVW
jgi:integrase